MENNNEKTYNDTYDSLEREENSNSSSSDFHEGGVKEALKDWISSPLDYTGKTKRKPFWIVQLFLFIINVVALVPLMYYSMIPSSGTHFDRIMVAVWLIFFAVNIILLFINIPLTVRRVRDTGITPFAVLLILIPSLGHIIVLILCALPTDMVKNNHS